MHRTSPVLSTLRNGKPMPTTTLIPNRVSTPAQSSQIGDSIWRALVRLIRGLRRQKRESLEMIVARSIDQAFAEFAKEMGR
jgi:hypothetical protein